MTDYIRNGVDLAGSNAAELVQRLKAWYTVADREIQSDVNLTAYLRVDALDAATRIEELEKQVAALEDNLARMPVPKEETEWVIPIRADLQLYIDGKKVSFASVTSGPQ